MLARVVFGIDVSSRTSHLCIMDNQMIVKETVIANNRPGFQRLAAYLRAYRQPEVVFEATGVYSKRLQYFLTQIRQPYPMLNPLKAKMQLAEFRLNKDDKNDARGLAFSQYAHRRSLTQLQARPYRELKLLSHYYEDLNRDYVRNKNRLHKLLQFTFPELENLFKQHQGRHYWQIVQLYPHPDLILKSTPAAVKQSLLRLKHLNPKQAEKLTRKLFALAHLAYPAVPVQSYALEQVALLAEHAWHLEQSLQHVNQEMSAVNQQLPHGHDVQLIESLPGAGKKTALRLVAELGDVRRFRTSAKLNAYLGIDLRKYESGQFIATRHISKRGNPIGRKLIFLLTQDMVSAAKRSAQKQSHIADFYLRRKKSSPATKPKKIFVAAASRVLRTIWILINKNQVYDYEKACAKH